MKKLSLILFACILAVFTGCKKDNATTDSGGSGNGGGGNSGGNESPTCSITSPQNGATFSYDENITVSVYAEDSDGSIVEVSLYLDNVGYQNKTEFPYNFVITSGILEPGTHVIKAIAKDNSGSNGENSVTITIQQPATESPDFVSFSDGNIPPTWHTATWTVDNTGGYDDIYSLKITNQGSVTTTKTINGKGYLEFYTSGNVSDNYDDLYYLKLYIDGNNYFYYTVENFGSWNKYVIDLEAGEHTFLWEYNYSGRSCKLDAIRFSHNSTNLRIGDSYLGGYIGYLDQTRQHGYIISINDLGYNNYSGAITTCENYVNDQYDDWFLPDAEQSVLICKALRGSSIYNLINGEYWTSSSYLYYGYHYGIYVFPDCYSYYTENEYMQLKVRAIRSF